MKSNLRNFDFLNHKEAEQFSHLIEREKSRAWVRRYIETGNLSEFFIGEENESNVNVQGGGQV